MSFIWPGLGHSYAGQPHRAQLYAMPRAVLLIGAAVRIGQAPEVFALRVRAPSFALAVVATIVLHGTWRAISIVDAWRALRVRGRRGMGSFMLAVGPSLLVVTGHGLLGYYTYSVNEAGGRIVD